MKEIVNVNEKWGIGAKGDLLCTIPADMKFFRETTRGKVVIMGLNTLKSLPGMKPLKGRYSVILAEKLEMIPEESIKACDCYLNDLSKAADAEAFHTPGATVMIAVTDLFELVDIITIFPQDDVYVCGGASVYKQLLPYCDTCLVTKNDCKTEPEVFFPNLDEDPAWEMTEEGEEQEYEGIHFRYTTYKRVFP